MIEEHSVGRLNDMLHEELTRLMEIDIHDDEALKAEVSRAQAVQRIACEINKSAGLVLKTAERRVAWGVNKKFSAPKMLDG